MPAEASARAAGLASPEDPALTGEVQWALDHASPAVRGVLRRLPARTRPAGGVGALVSELQTKITSG